MRSRAVVVVLALGLLVGCASEAEPDGPGSPPVVSGSPGSVAPTEAEPSPTSPPAPTPTVAPAAGEKLTIPSLEDDVFTFRLPEDGDWFTSRAGRAGNLTTGLRYWRIDGGASPAADSSTLDSGAEQSIDLRASGGPELTRSDNRVIDGVEGYVVEGSGRRGYTYIFGTVYQDSTTYLSFEFPNDSAKAKAWVEAVLASVEWV